MKMTGKKIGALARHCMPTGTWGHPDSTRGPQELAAQGSEFLSPRKTHTQKGPPRESRDASGNATCHWGVQAEVHNVKGISALGWAPFH